MNIQYVRLDDEVCEAINRLAQEEDCTVSSLVNQALREYLSRIEHQPAEAGS